MGETNLDKLLATMRPVLHEGPYVFCSLSHEAYEDLPFEPLGVFREPEGVSVIAEERQAVAQGFPFDSSWACITLTVHSSLTAVGFLAAVAARLAAADISLNSVAAYHHDHLFVPWSERWRALEILRELSGAR